MMGKRLLRNYRKWTQSQNVRSLRECHIRSNTATYGVCPPTGNRVVQQKGSIFSMHINSIFRCSVSKHRCNDAGYI